MVFPLNAGAFLHYHRGGTDGGIGGRSPPLLNPTKKRGRRRMTVETPSFLLQGKQDNPQDATNNKSTRRRQEQERLIEEIALMGAENIATLSISERAKRALLAEAIEDRIFRLTEELEVMVGPDGSVVDEGNRETVMETARTVKELQQQYAELVSGGPSSVLTAMNSLGDSMKSD